MSSVVFIPKLKDAKTKRQDENTGEVDQKSGEFKKVFDRTAAEMGKPQVIQCETNGYTKNAQMMTFLYHTKEYKMK